MATIAELAHDGGFKAMSATEICRLAHMSRGTFYELFGTSFAARRYAFAAAYERIFGPVPGAAGESGSWLEGLNSAIGVLFTGIAAEPLLAELCLVHSASAPDEARGHDSQAGIETMAGLLCGGREAGREVCGELYHDPPALSEEYLARAIVSVTALRVGQGEAATLPAHREEMVMLAASSFLGAELAGPACREI